MGNSPSPTQYHDTSVDNLVVPNVFKLSPRSKNDDPKSVIISQNNNSNASELVTMGNRNDTENDCKRPESKFQETANNNNPLNSPLNVNNLLNSSTNPANLSIFNSPYFNRFASPTRANANNNLQHTLLPSTLRKNSNLITNSSMDIHFTPSVSRILKLEASQTQNTAINNSVASKSQNFSTFNSTPLPKQRLSKVKDNINSTQVGQSTQKQNSNSGSLHQDKSLMSQPFFSNGIFLNTEPSSVNLTNSNTHGSPNLDLIKTPPPANCRSQSNSNPILPMSISKDPEYFLLSMNSILRNTSSAVSSMMDSSANKASNAVQQTLLNIKDHKVSGNSLDYNTATPRSNIKANNHKSSTVASLYPELFTANESFSLEFQKYMTANTNTVTTNSAGINLLTNNNNNGHSIKTSTAQDFLRITPYKPIDGSAANLLGTTTIERIKKEIIDSTADDISKIHGDDIEGDSTVWRKHDAPCFDSPTRVKIGRNHYHGNHLPSRRLSDRSNNNENNNNLHSLQLHASRIRKLSDSNHPSQSNNNDEIHRLQDTMTPSSINLRSHRINSDDLDVDLMESTPSRYAGISFVERIRTYCEHQGLNNGGSISNNIDEDDLVDTVDDDIIIDANAILVESTPTKRLSSFSQNSGIEVIPKSKKKVQKLHLSAVNSNGKNFVEHSASISKTKKAYEKRANSKRISDLPSNVSQSVINIAFNSDDDKDTEYEDDGDGDDEIKDLINSDSLTGSTQIMPTITNQTIVNLLQYNFTNFQSSYPIHPQKHHYGSTGNLHNDVSTLTIIPHTMNVQRSQLQTQANTNDCSSMLYSQSITGCYDDAVGTMHQNEEDDVQTDDPDGTLSLPSSPLRTEDSALSISNVSHNNSNMSTGAVRYNSTAGSSIIEEHSINSKDNISNNVQQQKQQQLHNQGHLQFNQPELSNANITTSSNVSDSFFDHHGNHNRNISLSFLLNRSSTNNLSVLHPAIGTFQTKTHINETTKNNTANMFIPSGNAAANSKQTPFFNDNIQSMNQMVKNASSSKKKSNKRKRGSELSVIYSKYMSNPQDVAEADNASNKRLKSRGNKKIQTKSKSFNDATASGHNKSSGNKRTFVVARNTDDKENIPQLKGTNINSRKILGNTVGNTNTSPLKDITVNVSSIHGNDCVMRKIVQRSNTHPNYVANSNGN